MCYSVEEARFLAVEHGHDDLMVAYPCSKQELHSVWDIVVVHGKNMQVKGELFNSFLKKKRKKKEFGK